jgi:hypothetical protein
MQVKTLKQAQEKLQQAINLNAQDEANYWRDWIKEYEKVSPSVERKRK